MGYLLAAVIGFLVGKADCLRSGASELMRGYKDGMK